MAHISVLLNESIDGLAIQEGDVFVDCTLGDGGHSLEVFKRFGDKVTIVGIDRDQDAIDRVHAKFTELSAHTVAGALTEKNRIVLEQGNFRYVDEILRSTGLQKADKFLFDIGLNSRQLAESGRGFSFQKDEPLVMTFESGKTGLNAKDVLNDWAEESLSQIIFGFGEERHARRIARGIVEARERKPIETTAQLVEIIRKSTPAFYHFGKIHPATRTFQAIRIAVNDELGALTDGLKKAWSILAPKGRIAVISFHSLEDRIVKNYFNELKKSGEGLVHTKRPLIASDQEMQANPRSRSAKLRIIERAS